MDNAVDQVTDTVTGTLDKFHLGVSADGRSCVMVFMGEDRHTINCVADFAEFNAFIASLNHAANEMARRRTSRFFATATSPVAMPTCSAAEITMVRRTMPRPLMSYSLVCCTLMANFTTPAILARSSTCTTLPC